MGFPNWSPQKSVWMFPGRSAPDPEPTQDLSRSPLSRNGAMSQVRNPVWLKHSSRIFKLQHCCPYLAYLVEYAIAKFITSIKNSYSFGKGQYLWNIMGTM